MKFRKIMIALLAVMLFLCCLPVQAAEETPLTVKRAILINDNQVVIEFSEPIALNYHQSNRGPHIAIRFINKNGALQKFTDCDVVSPYYDVNLQWNGTHQFVDGNRDRLIWTKTDGAFGAETIRDIVECKGVLAPLKDKYRVVLAIEEVPYDTNAAYTDNAICNITTTDGTRYLEPMMPSGWEKTNIPMDIDYNYYVDPSKFIAANVVDQNKRPNPLSKGNGIEIEVKDPQPIEQVVRNNPFVGLTIIGGWVVLAAILTVVVILIKKRKAA